MKTILTSLFLYEVDTCAEPLIDFYETDDFLVFEADVPGIEPSNVSIRVYEDLLVIQGVRTIEDDEASIRGTRFLCMERNLKSFRRMVRIPIPVNTTAGKAVYNNGVVTIRFPKLKGKLIRISVERL